MGYDPSLQRGFYAKVQETFSIAVEGLLSASAWPGEVLLARIAPNLRVMPSARAEDVGNTSMEDTK